MQINKSITSIDVSSNTIGAVGQSALFVAATQKLVEARRNHSPASLYLAIDAPTDFRTAKLRTSYLETAKQPLREKNCCTLAWDLLCCSKKQEIDSGVDALEERQCSGDLVYVAVVLVFAPLVGMWLWLTLISASMFLILRKKSMFSLFDVFKRASSEDLSDVFKSLFWERELNSDVPWYIVVCFWLPLSAVVWLPLYFAWGVFGSDTANQNSIRAYLSSLCGATLLLVAIVIWGFKKEDTFKTTGQNFFRTHTYVFCLSRYFAGPNQHA